MATAKTCSVCGKNFEMKFRYQVVEDGAGARHFCSQRCQQKHLGVDRGAASCSHCAKPFKLEFAWQVLVDDHGTRFMCTQACRDAIIAAPPPPRATRRIAVFNHKGGTGKTTTSVSVAAGLAMRGFKVLLVDTDSQGNVGVSLGVKAEKTLYHTLVMGLRVQDVAVKVRENFDVLPSNETLAAAELYLAGRQNRDRILKDRLAAAMNHYDVVLLDCSPSLSLLNQNALVFADGILVPVACDFLSLVGVRQVIKTVKNVNSLLHHPVQIHGVLPTFYDARARICRDAWGTMKEHFGERCFQPIRSTTRIKEAPAQGKTIYEHAPKSDAALDYQRVVDRLITGHVGEATPDVEVDADEAMTG